MTCARCEAWVADALRAVPGVAKVAVSVADGAARVEAASVSRAALEDAVRRAGYACGADADPPAEPSLETPLLPPPPPTSPTAPTPDEDDGCAWPSTDDDDEPRRVRGGRDARAARRRTRRRRRRGELRHGRGGAALPPTGSQRS